MNIQIGDTVRFLSEKLEGKVTNIAGRTTVNVFVPEYGFEIPAALDDLVVIHTDIARTPSAGSRQPSAAAPIPVEPADQMLLAVVPDNYANLAASRFELFLVNDTRQTSLYSAAFRQDGKYTGIAAGNCAPGTAVSLGQYSLKEIADRVHAVRVQAIFFEKGATTPRPAIEAEIRISAPALCRAGAYAGNRWFPSVALLRPLEKKQGIILEDINEQELQQAVAEKRRVDTPAPAPAPKNPTPNVVEVDLHATALLETTAGMAPHDILEYQLDIFRRTMEEYKLRHGQKIVFIHGKGEGVLRQRILWELETKYKRHRHQDASFKQYGFGATLVVIR